MNHEWDFSYFGDTTSEAFERKRKEWQTATQMFVQKWKQKKEYCDSVFMLREALDEYESWASTFGATSDEFYYFWLKSSQDQSNPALKASYNKVAETSKAIQNEVSFFELTLGKISKEKQAEFLSAPSLQKYRHFLNRLFAKAAHTLSEQEEKIILLKSESANALWVAMTSEFLSQEERTLVDETSTSKTLPFEGLMTLMNSKQKEVRDRAALAVNEILEKHLAVAQAELNAILQDKKVDDTLRGYSTPEAERHLQDDIDSQIVATLVETVSSHFSVSSEYYALKAKLLKLPKISYHERNIEYGEFEKEYPYENALSLVKKTFSTLDPLFVQFVEMFEQKGQIDVFPRKGKSSGAFCVHMLKSQPTYILLNHTNKLRDVQTLAHELGHAINNECIRQKQHALDFGTPTSTAEVASTFMEDFVLDELRQDADEETRLFLLMQKLNNDISSIMRQVACYRFEQELHRQYRERGFLSKDEIGALFQKSMAAYMGPAVEQSSGSQNWWVYWSHIRRHFYVYSYASGLLISKAMQKKVRENPTFIENVREFLSAGTSDSPKNIFLKMDIDISKKQFWEEGLLEIKKNLDEAKTLAKKLGKIE